MNHKLLEVIENRNGNYLFPFFWQHGEDEVTLREYMSAINGANIGAVCVESRPHPDFCGPQWWHDMDIILDEARKRKRKVWILDDSHFPTGYANGALEDKPDSYCRRSITCRTVEAGDEEGIILDEENLAHPEPAKKTAIDKEIEKIVNEESRLFDGDRLLCVCAREMNSGNVIDLTEKIHNNRLSWDIPSGKWKVYIVHITGNAGYHRQYINMMDKASCRLLIDAVYEKHYEHYKGDFGKTIAGFFSDEPELGNGHFLRYNNFLGTDQDLPWSAELEERLVEKWGKEFALKIPLLWINDSDPDVTAHTRYTYMDAVTRLVETCFSRQIGDWRRTHGIEYIGHVIEDNNQHCRTGMSLGHFFRGMSGQDIAGIDVIGNQVTPQGEDSVVTGRVFGNKDGEFFHYALAKLGACGALVIFCIFMQKTRLTGLLWEFARYKFAINCKFIRFSGKAPQTPR
ncbi:MAG: hypothetical protein LBQ88_17880, partial [Treponema sp.]|nr:hypothetical protein [Treponema sp.]